VYKGQTLKDLASKYNRSIRWVQTKIKEYEPDTKLHKPRAINLICDAN